MVGDVIDMVCVIYEEIPTHFVVRGNPRGVVGWLGLSVQRLAGRARNGGARGNGGLVTLEWLLVLGAIAGIAAGSYLAVDRVLEQEIRRPAPPGARLVAADVVAAVVVQDAIDLAISQSYDPATWDSVHNPPFRARCEALAESSTVRESGSGVGPPEWDAALARRRASGGNALPAGPPRVRPAAK